DHIEVSREGSLQAYLRQALSHRLIDLYRRRRTQPNGELLGSDLPASEPSPLESAIGAEALTRYEQALHRLSAVDREAVILRVEFQHSYDEIAGMLGKASASSARMTVSRALAKLSREMQA
ncbi:MAG: sigma-70 family RNA polymerase sigma factor, partial [Acidobacteriota bacterium]|nr:sigma-70 family RNA polymerase sigma factor [Acidobacteriota bacterium]